MTERDVRLAWGAATDAGLRRKVNEDSFLAQAPVFLVADGMGGHESGAEASRRAIDCFAGLAGRERVEVEAVQRAFASAVEGVGAIPAERFPPGTTLSGVVVCRHAGVPYWLILNVGDSRTYRLSRGELEQISVDHSAVQSLVEQGRITADEAERHPQRSVITRALGAGSTATPDYWLLPAAQGERMLVCSDGLTKELDSSRIEAILREEAAPQAAATRLVHEALLHGGKDNVTVVVVDAVFVDLGEDEATADQLDIETAPSVRTGEGAGHAQI